MDFIESRPMSILEGLPSAPEMVEEADKNLAFWNERAALGDKAGTQDLIAAQLEREAIAKHVKDGMRVLDVGCGNGLTVIEMAKRFDISILGIDYSPAMVNAAKYNVGTEYPFGAGLKGRAHFCVGNVAEGPFREITYTVDLAAGDGLAMPMYEPPYDLVYTQRCLINLPDWSSQEQAIRNIIRLLKPGGTYVACECCVEGLASINDLRAMVGLPAIVPPSHNVYIHSGDMRALQIEGAFLAGCEFPNSTYYLASRVFNAALAAQEGKEPQYDAAINRLALKLPSIGNLGQTRLWVWRRND